jgi:hypothetical protein
MCIIPKKSKIQKDEYVGIKRIEKEVKKWQKKRKKNKKTNIS